MSEKDGGDLQVEIDEATARGVYSNLAFISHSETEFILDFTFLQPQTRRTKVLTRVVTSPLHMKRLLWALQENLARYEERFGVLDAGKPADVGGAKPDFYQ